MRFGVVYHNTTSFHLKNVCIRNILCFLAMCMSNPDCELVWQVVTKQFFPHRCYEVLFKSLN